MMPVSCLSFFLKESKGKFLIEGLVVGNREFDLKMTARVNMSMVGVPEYTFDMWAAQFIARGYKVAKVDQVESALGKEMREKGSGSKGEGIIKRELSCILTGGTLVEEGMLQDEMSVYCVAIKVVPVGSFSCSGANCFTFRKILLQMGVLVLGLPLLIQQLAHSNLPSLKMTWSLPSLKHS